MRKRAVGLGLAVLLSMGLAACSDDGDGGAGGNGGGGGDRLSAAELATQGDAVCTKLDNDVKGLADSFPVSVDFTNEQMQEYYMKVLPLVDGAVTSFKALKPPEDLEQAFEAALAQLAIDRQTLEGATASPEAARNLFDTQVDPFTATNQKLAAAGITACGGTATTTTTAAAATSSTTGG